MSRAARRRAFSLCCAAAACLGVSTLHAQDPSSAPASIPAGVIPAGAPQPASSARPVSEKQAREADDAYLTGARAMQRGDLAAAERGFGRAAQLNPARDEYLRSLSIAREHRVQELVTQAAAARGKGDTGKAGSLLEQARTLAPDSRIVTQHFDVVPDAIPGPMIVEPAEPTAANGFGFGDPVLLKPTAVTHSFHQTSPVEEVLRAVYAAYGIKVQFPAPVGAGRTLRFDLEDADFATATRVIGKIANTMTVPVQPNAAIVVPNTQEARDQYQPLMEETLYMPGITGEAMTELANVARQVFDLKQVNASQTQGNMLLRGDPQSLKLLNATYADMLAGTSDVQIDVTLYEVDKSHTRNVGVTTPSSAGGFSLYQEVQSLLTQNASTISAAVSSGALVLTGDPKVDIPKEIAVLYAAGALSSLSQFTGLLGTLGTYGGIPLVGVYLGSGATINLALNSTDVRTLDFAQLRATERQPASFKAGTRYPVITGTYSSGVASSALSGLTAAQQALVSKYLGSSTSVSIPQFQYEDLGLSLKATPTVHGDRSVTLQLDMKIEALGGTSINNVPVLNNRVLTSTITVPSGQTVLLASEVTNSELRSISGLPGLGDLPGFEGTNHDVEKNTTELLIMLTPHVVRLGHHAIASRRLAITSSNGVQ